MYHGRLRAAKSRKELRGGATEKRARLADKTASSASQKLRARQHTMIDETHDAFVSDGSSDGDKEPQILDDAERPGEASGAAMMDLVVDNPATLVGLGDVSSMPVILAAVGFAIMAILDKRGVPGSIIIGILAVSIIAWVSGVSAIDGVVGSVPPAVHAFSMDFSLVATAGFIGVAFAFLFVDFFDTAGTLTSVANLTGKVDQDGNVDGIGRAVLADSTATTIGALVGTSNTTSYIESGAGVKEGGRTGLTAVAVAVLFAICLFLAPLAQSIPAFATAPALVFVATFFLKNLRDIEWDDVSEYAPAVLAAVLMPLTFSIAHGIALGFIAYVVIKALSGRHEDLNAGSIVIGVLSVLYFIF